PISLSAWCWAAAPSANDLSCAWPWVPSRPKRMLTSLATTVTCQNLALVPPTNSKRRVMVWTPDIDVRIGNAQHRDLCHGRDGIGTHADERREPGHTSIGQFLVAKRDDAADRRRVLTLGICESRADAERR